MLLDEQIPSPFLNSLLVPAGIGKLKGGLARCFPQDNVSP